VRSRLGNVFHTLLRVFESRRGGSLTPCGSGAFEIAAAASPGCLQKEEPLRPSSRRRIARSFSAGLKCMYRSVVRKLVCPTSSWMAQRRRVPHRQVRARAYASKYAALPPPEALPASPRCSATSAASAETAALRLCGRARSAREDGDEPRARQRASPSSAPRASGGLGEVTWPCQSERLTFRSRRCRSTSDCSSAIISPIRRPASPPSSTVIRTSGPQRSAASTRLSYSSNS
jgi:hypothetical protein